MQIALIDADGLLYQSSKDSIEESINIINEKINNIILKTECDYYALFLSSKKTFRHDIYPEYKKNRSKYPTKLLWIKTLRAYLIEKYNAFTMDNVEADDLVAYFHHSGLCVVGNNDIGMHIDTIPNIQGVEMEDIKYEVIETILCSPDKDLLNSFVGKHFNYTYQLKDKSDINPLVKGWWVETDINEGVKFIWHQMLMGDAADNISALSRVGKETAKKWLDTVHLNDCPEEVLSRYIAHYRDIPKAIFEYQKNYRLLYLLRNNEDFMREVESIPLLPEFNKVTQVENVEF